MMLIKGSCGGVRGQRGETIPNGVGWAKIRELQKFQLLPTPWLGFLRILAFIRILTFVAPLRYTLHLL